MKKIGVSTDPNEMKEFVFIIPNSVIMKIGPIEIKELTEELILKFTGQLYKWKLEMMIQS